MSALRYLAGLAALTVAVNAAGAQDVPTVISPLRVETDHNNVNLVTGRTTVDGPTLSIPAAPNLRFDRIQNAAPYVSGRVQNQGPEPSYDRRSYSVHSGAAASDSFECIDFDCNSITGSGSTYQWNSNVYRQAGSGARYSFNVLHVQTTGINQVLLYYASQVVYPNGETISYTYDSATLNGDPYPNRVFRRPNGISSSLGYSISITYQGSDFNGDANAWGTPAVVKLYPTGSPNAPIGQLTYSGNTVTDLGGRIYTCNGCNNLMGAEIEVAAGSTRLPTEGADNLTVTPTSGANVVASVARDGVAWTYGYNNLHVEASSGHWLYDQLTVNGPNGYHQVYAVANPVVGPCNPFSGCTHSNRITSVTDSIGRTTSYYYDEATRPTRIVAPEGNEAQVGYDQRGNIIWRTLVAKPGSGMASVTDTVSYPTDTCMSSGYPVLCWRPTWSRDGLNRQTDYAYNNNGQLTEQTDPADANGVRRRTITEYTVSPGGISRRTAVRVCGVGTTCGTNQEIRTEYLYPPGSDTLLPMTERRWDLANSVYLDTTYGYDNAGRLISTDGPLAGSADATYNRYDPNGRKTWEIGPADGNGVRQARRFTYRDSDDKPTLVETGTIPAYDSSVLSPQTSTAIAYDSHRSAIREAVSAGATTYSVTDKAYDDRGQLTCSTVRMNPAAFAETPGACAFTTYNAAYGPDRITRNIYDAAGQLLQIQRAYGVTIANGFPATLQQNYATYTYTGNGKQQTVTDANGNAAYLHWDGHDRQDYWVFPSRTLTGAWDWSDYEYYAYDAVGNRTTMRKRDGSWFTFNYDNLNRMISRIVPERAGLSSTHTRDVYYGYDLRNAQAFARFDSTSGEGVTNAYDAFGRQISSSLAMDSATRTLSYAYDPGSRRTRVTHPDGTYFTYDYDSRSRLVQVRENGSAVLEGFSFNASGLVAEQSYAGGAAGFSGYGYDSLDRPTSIGHNLVGTSPDVSFAFQRNAAGQITQRTRVGDAYAWGGAYNVSRSYAVNGLNQYTGAGGVTFAYDANANLTSDGSNSYVYDTENRLVSASGGHNAGLRYDPLGRLYEVTGSSGTTRFLYDGDALVGEYNTSGTLLRRYVHGSDAAADDPLVWYEGGAARYLLRDHQGSIIDVADGSGNAVAVNTYDEWGIPGAGNQGRFQYTGQAWLPELGMYHYKARIYSPTLGRFLQTDPVGYSAGINLYSYVGNDPTNRVDPSGLADVAAMCAGRSSCNVDMQQRVNIVHQQNGRTVVDSTIAVTMHFSKTTSGNNTTWSVSSSVGNVSGRAFSNSELRTMASTVSHMQLAAVGRGFGEQTTQMVTSIGIAETRLGTAPNPGAPAFKQSAVNPMQLSGGRANLDLDHNIRGAMDVVGWAGRPSNYDPTSTYRRYSDGSAPTMANWGGTYGSLTEARSQPYTP